MMPNLVRSSTTCLVMVLGLPHLQLPPSRSLWAYQVVLALVRYIASCMVLQALMCSSDFNIPVPMPSAEPQHEEEGDEEL